MNVRDGSSSAGAILISRAIEMGCHRPTICVSSGKLSAVPAPYERELTRRRNAAEARFPLLDLNFPAFIASRVPEIILAFWVVKILTIAGGDVSSDYLKTHGNFGGGGIEVLIIVIGVALQLSTRRYRAFAYWFLADAIATTGTVSRTSCSWMSTFPTSGRP